MSSKQGKGSAGTGRKKKLVEALVGETRQPVDKELRVRISILRSQIVPADIEYARTAHAKVGTQCA